MKDGNKMRPIFIFVFLLHEATQIMIYWFTTKTGNQLMKDSLAPLSANLRRKYHTFRAIPTVGMMTVMVGVLGMTNAVASPAVVLGNVTAAAGAVLLMPVSFEAADTKGISTLVVRLSLSPAQVTVLDVIPDASLSTSDKSLDFEIRNGQVSICVFGGTSDVLSGRLCMLLLRLQQGSSPGASVTVADTGTHGADKEASAVMVDVLEGVITTATGMEPHAADSDQDWSVSLPELLRIIQFYNVGSHHCDTATIDGFAPGTGDTGCPPHNADYNPADWKISFVELLRLIQLYNSPYAAYQVLGGTEDGFSPGPFGIFYDKRFAPGK